MNRFFEQEVIRRLNRIETKLDELLAKGKLAALQIQFKGEQVNMPATDPLGETIAATITGQDANGNPVPITVADLTVTTDNPAVATVTQDPTTGQPTFTPVGIGTCNVKATDTGDNPAGPISISDTLTITSGPLNKLILTWGNPMGPLAQIAKVAS